MVYAENKSNYCPRCQTGGKILADLSFLRLLKENWPRTVEELEGRGQGLAFRSLGMTLLRNR